MDVGVWMGYHSVALAKLAAPHRVLSLEADAWAAARATQNLRHNNARNVELVRTSASPNRKDLTWGARIG